MPLPKNPASWVFSKDKVIVKEPGDPDNVCTWKINPDKKPKELDVTGENSVGKVVTGQAIYEIEGDTLRVAVSEDAPEGKRPTAFDAKRIIVITYKRKEM
jgi:uncharacterized protein (TIGR03067 family)